MIHFNLSYVLDEFQLCRIVLFKQPVWSEESVIIQFTNVINKKMSVWCDARVAGLGTERKRVRVDAVWQESIPVPFVQCNFMVAFTRCLTGGGLVVFSTTAGEVARDGWLASPEVGGQVL
ncbi:hypothetical protein M0R45_036479 [Rubus argutus]|uniref:Uncharacterized protein n=1 Tax=Rubus argutus TaxID=59490 RepID=A0AAW1W1N6_RUBAR